MPFLDVAELEQIANVVVAKINRQTELAARMKSDRLGYDEEEAGALLGVAKHVLRDARLRGEISARKVGKKWIYSRQTLIDFLEGREHESLDNATQY